MATQVNFETSLKSLEDLVKKLETGDLPLEQAMQFFEDGIKLSKLCSTQLDEAQKKIEILVNYQNNEKQTKPFQLEEEK